MQAGLRDTVGSRGAPALWVANSRCAADWEVITLLQVHSGIYSLGHELNCVV